MFTAVLLIDIKMKTIQCLSTDEEINKMQYILTMDYY